MTTPHALADTLRLHSLWLTGQKGKRADLTGADLSGYDLIGANLTGADLRGADLRGRRSHRDASA